MRELEVYFNDVKAGLLIERSPSNGYIFKYDDEYLKSEFPAVSVRLPKRQQAYEEKYLFSVFANMLPEGGNRRQLCRYYKIDESDLFGILELMADKDFIGAVNVHKVRNDEK
ncbi:MAG: HipA N-terminal domain-containing protein [Muribaculaceae bacterium]